MKLLQILTIGAVMCFALFLLTPKGVFVSKSRAVRALEAQGYSNITIINKNVCFITWHGGSNDDKVKFTAKATNPAGKQVTVYVFSGWIFKGSTIRTP